MIPNLQGKDGGINEEALKKHIEEQQVRQEQVMTALRAQMQQELEMERQKLRQQLEDERQVTVQIARQERDRFEAEKEAELTGMREEVRLQMRAHEQEQAVRLAEVSHKSEQKVKDAVNRYAEQVAQSRTRSKSRPRSASCSRRRQEEDGPYHGQRSRSPKGGRAHTDENVQKPFTYQEFKYKYDGEEGGVRFDDSGIKESCTMSLFK